MIKSDGFISGLSNRIKISHVVIIWFLVNAASAFFTQLYSDEAYYVLYAQHPGFGYFDHPPMIAMMIKAGRFMFNNEFGVRFLSLISVTIALYLIYKLSGVNNPLLFLAAILSIFGLNILGFLALPDSPLLLFGVLFFAAYKRFLVKQSFLNSLLTGITIACMLYSKYQGILIILFTVLSNLKLLKSGKFYLSAFVALVLFMPHILWEFNNGMVSITYHLSERSAPGYKATFTLGYIFGQLLYYGPFTAVFMFIATIRFRQSDLFERALKWNLWGFLLFFLLFTLKGRIEVNWTFPVLIPLLIFFLRSGSENPLLEKLFYITAFPVILLIAFIRIEAAYPLINIGSGRIDDFRGHRELGKEVDDKSNGLPVITSDYQRAGLISFYSKAPAVSININSRRNQFNLWHFDDSLRFKKVAFVNNYLKEGSMIQTPYYRGYKITVIDSLPVMNDILIRARLKKSVFHSGEPIILSVLLDPSGKPSDYRDAGNYTTRLNAELFSGNDKMIAKVCELPVDLLLIRDKGKYDFGFTAPLQHGTYKIMISLNTSELGIWSTRQTVKFTVR
jgi:Dolichyl-phosphate-mannose-protein mannosyltransferase